MSRRVPSPRCRAWPHPYAVVLLALPALVASPAQAADPVPSPAAPEPTSSPSISRFHLGPWEQDIGYAQAVRAGQFLFVSGTTGRGDLGDPQGMANALRTAYERIRTTLEAHDVGFDQVVRETIYTRDIEALKAAAAARREFYRDGRYPASTWVQVDRLFEDDCLVEVELVAILP